MYAVDIDRLGIPAFVVDILPDGEMRFAALNAANLALTGFRSEDVVARPFSEWLPRRVVDHITARYRECIERRTLHEYDELLDLPGNARWWRTTLKPVMDPVSGHVVQIVGVASEITEHKALEENLTDAAFRDPLTGVANRRMLGAVFADAVSEAEYTNRSFSLILIDLDGFKLVNDTFGHGKGDDVLRHVASLLSLTTRRNETVARIGGDEFALKVSAGCELELSATVASLRRFLDRSMSIADVELNIGASVGGAVWSGQRSMSDLLAVADAAMYAEKARRRLAVVV